MTPRELIESTRDNSKDLTKSGIYAIYNFISDKIYIGQTKRDIARRFREHRRHLIGDYHNNPILKNSWNFYGADAFAYIILENCPEGDLNERELFYGSLLPRECLMNCSPLGEGVPISDVTRAKLKAKRKLRVFDEPIKKKIGDAHRGRVHTESARKNMSNGHINCKCHTKEAIAERAKRRSENAKSKKIKV